MENQRPTMIYDGNCGFCKRSVAFLLARDRKGVLDSASNLEDPRVLADPELVERSRREMLLFDGDEVYGGAQAALRSWLMVRPWSWLRLFTWPPFSWIASLVYRWIARNRMLASRILRIPATCEIPRRKV